MDKNKESLKAEFVLDVSTLNKQLDAASRKLTESMKRATDNMARVMAGNTAVWGASGAKIGTTMGTSIAHGVTRALAGLGGSITRTVGRIATAPFRMLASPLGMITGGVGAYGVVKGFEKVINAGRDLQSEQVQIQKTTNLTDSAIAHLTQRLIEFSNATGSSRSAMMGLAADAGRLGVRSTEDLEKFATTFIKAATATNVGPDMAEEVLRVMNSIGESVGNVDRLMSAVNELGNNLATNERRILDFMGTMPGLNTILGLSTSQLLGFAAAASTTANEAGLVGTAMNSLATAMLKGVSEGGKSLAIFSKTAGMSNEEWTALVARDKNEALLRFIEGIKRTRDAGGDLISIFSDMGSEGARLVRVMMSLSQITDSLRTSQARAAAELQQNTSLNQEFGRRLNTVAAQQQRVTSALSNFIATLNDNKLNTEIFKTLADVLQNMITNNQVALAGRFTGFIERLGRVVVGLPFDFEKARIAFNGMISDPAYLQGVFGNLASWFGDVLLVTLKTVFVTVAEIAKIIMANVFDPMFARAGAQIADLQFIIGNKVQGLAALSIGMKPSDIVKIIEMSGDKDALKKVEQAASARGGFRSMMTLGGAANQTLTTDWLLNQVIRDNPALLEFYKNTAPGYREMSGVKKSAEAEMNARITNITAQSMSTLGKQVLELATTLGKLNGVLTVSGTTTQSELDVIQRKKSTAQEAYDRGRQAAKDAVRNPLRGALEAPIRQEAQKRGIDFDSMSEERKRALINRYYSRNPFPAEMQQLAGVDSQQGLNKILRTKLREERYADQRANFFSGGNLAPLRQPAGDNKLRISLTPESKTINLTIDDSGRIVGAIKFVEAMQQASSAAALTGG